MSAAERARVTTFVAVAPDVAFEVFTGEIDRWWRRGPRFRMSPGQEGEVCFERDARGQRLIERMPDRVREIGRVLTWEPGRRLVFEWRGANFAPGESTEVEVRFEAFNQGTRVTLEHRGWETIRGDHPARHGKQDRAFGVMIGTHWSELMTAYRQYASGPPA
jgi:uncharacterized protein YndB with AHSA1/START domain